MVVRNTLPLTIEKLVSGGYGLARIDGKAVFVIGGLPGETVTAEKSPSKGGVEFYRAIEIVSPSPFRRAPACPHFGICGGCSWLDFEYTAQVEAKLSIFAEQLRRVGKIHNIPSVIPFTGCESGYRRRAQIKFDRESHTAGFFKADSNEVVSITHCPLLDSALNDVLLKIPSYIDSVPSHARHIRLLGADSGVLSSPVLDNCTTEKGVITVGSNKIAVSGDSFFQSNRFLTEALSNWVSDHASGEYCIDLFGGAGFFSLAAGRNFKKGLLVEQNQEMAKSAEKSFGENGLSHFTARGITAELFFKNTLKKEIPTVIVDPPRTGLAKEVRLGIAALIPETIIYISCDPSTQARDLGFFINEKGYRITAAALFDLYPNTHHIETGVVLSSN